MNPSSNQSDRMDLVQTFNHPIWWLERELTLHRVCLGLEVRKARGERITRAIKAVSLYWHGKPFKTNPRKRLRLSTSTLWRLYHQWKLNGKTPEALTWKFREHAGSFKFRQPHRN